MCPTGTLMTMGKMRMLQTYLHIMRPGSLPIFPIRSILMPNPSGINRDKQIFCPSFRRVGLPGLQKWAIRIDRKTGTYFDKAANAVLVERRRV
jgi:hypothetical protein